MSEVRVCGLEGCEISLEGRSSRARFCCDSHRYEAWTQRRSREAAHPGLSVDNGRETPSGSDTGAATHPLSRQLPDGRWRTIIGPKLAITVPADWPQRSARFWERMDEIKQRRRGYWSREGRR